MVHKSRQMATSIAAGQSMEVREEPRQFLASSQSFVSPTKSMAFTFDDDEPPAYMNDLPRGRDRYSRTRAWDANWRNFDRTASVYSPPPPHSRGLSLNVETEPPLRPNRRDDPEFGTDGLPLTSQVFLPASANNKPTKMKSTSEKPGKNWLRHFKSPIGEPHAICSYLTLWCADRHFP
jgi:hypothetical protein